MQATGKTDFEDGLRTGTKLEVRNGLQSVHTIPEVNMVSPLGLSHTGISDKISIQALSVQIQGSFRGQMKPKYPRYQN